MITLNWKLRSKAVISRGQRSSENTFPGIRMGKGVPVAFLEEPYRHSPDEIGGKTLEKYQSARPAAQFELTCVAIVTLKAATLPTEPRGLYLNFFVQTNSSFTNSSFRLILA